MSNRFVISCSWFVLDLSFRNQFSFLLDATHLAQLSTFTAAVFIAERHNDTANTTLKANLSACKRADKWPENVGV